METDFVDKIGLPFIMVSAIFIIFICVTYVCALKYVVNPFVASHNDLINNLKQVNLTNANSFDSLNRLFEIVVKNQEGLIEILKKYEVELSTVGDGIMYIKRILNKKVIKDE